MDVTRYSMTYIEWRFRDLGERECRICLTNNKLEPLDFPTMQDDNGYVGKCAKLVTRSTGSFGSGFGMPIAAGNLFIGTFDLLNAIPDARKGTRLGRPFDHVRLT